jgi:hypothetical protein
MSKTLAWIAGAGFVLSIVFFTGAFLIAGDQLFASSKPLAAIAPLVDGKDRKEWRWNGGDTLRIEAPVKLHYSARGEPGVTVTGPADLLAQVKVGGGQIVAGNKSHDGRKLEATVSGVPIRKFTVTGNQDLELGHIDQDMLDVRIAGRGSVSGEGKVDQLNIVIAGRGDANLGGLIARDAKIAIMGNGDAIVAPQQTLVVTVAGRGTVRLKSHPVSIRKTIIGSGDVIQEDGGHAESRGAMLSSSGAGASGGNFVITGHGSQDLGRFDGGDVKLVISGSGSATAEGRVDNLSVMISGSGKAHLGKLSARTVQVTVAGSGDATVAPQDEARVTILGSGDVYLATRPQRIERNIMGSGDIIEAR